MPRHLRLVDARDAATPQAPVRVMLAEAHPAMRRSLRLLLDGEPCFQIVAETSDLAQTLARASAVKPDVLVLDLRLPGASGVAVIDELRSEAPGLEIVVLTMQESPMAAKRALDGGALGFVLKDTADMELPEAVARAARGAEYTSPRVASGLEQLRRAAG